LQRNKADISNPAHIGASMSGTVVKVIVEKGDKVSKVDHLMITKLLSSAITTNVNFFLT
jgi:pyruvate carboxylase